MKYIFTIIISLITIPLFCQDTLKVAVYDKAPFGMQEENGSFSGLMVELWEDIADELNVDYQYELVDMKSLLNGIQQGEYNIGLGAISVTPEREQLVDFTYAVNPSGTTIAAAKHKTQIGFFQKWAPILKTLLELLVALMLMLLTAATLVWLVERKHVKEVDNDKNIKTIADGLWWSAVTMTTVGYGDKVPMSRFGKIIGIIWIFTSIVFFSLFTANASAKLAKTNQYHNKFSTVDDLRKAKVIAVANSSGEAFVKREKIQYKQVATLDEALNLIIDGKDDAIVYNAPVLKYYNKFIRHNELEISNKFLLKNNMAIAIEENSPYRERINIALLEKIAEPKWQSAVYKYIGD